jgi:hypothetical protein
MLASSGIAAASLTRVHPETDRSREILDGRRAADADRRGYAGT